MAAVYYIVIDRRRVPLMSGLSGGSDGIGRVLFIVQPYGYVYRDRLSKSPDTRQSNLKRLVLAVGLRFGLDVASVAPYRATLTRPGAAMRTAAPASSLAGLSTR